MEPQDNKQNLKDLHQQLVQDNYAVPADLKSFESTFQNPENAKDLFKQLQADNYAIPTDYDSFVNTFGLKKKDYVSDLYSNIFSKVAGDIPKLENPDQKVKSLSEISKLPPSTEPVQYPHWSDVSKALGIEVPKEVTDFSTETGIPLKDLGVPETVGGKKPEAKKQSALKDFTAQSQPKETTQPADKTIAKTDLREPYIFTLDDYFKKRGVYPEEVGLAPDVNLDRFIDANERIDFDKKLESKGIYKPTSQYRESYLGGALNGLYKGTANMIRDIGYMLVDVSEQNVKKLAKKAGEIGTKIASKIEGVDSETTKKYVEQVASAIDNGLYGTDKQSILKEGYEDTAKWFEELVKTRTPNNAWGRALENTGAFVPDLISIGLMPEAKAPLLLKYGMQGMLKFPVYLGVKTNIEKSRENAPLGENYLQTAESMAQGMTFNGLGVWGAYEVGAISKSIGAGLWGSKATEILANSLGFGGITSAQGGDAKQGILEGLAFSALGTPEMIKQGMQKKAMLNWMTATDNNIRMVASQKIDPFKLRKESQELWEKAQALPEGQQRDYLLWQKNMVDNTIDLSFMTNQILRNPDAFIKSINENTMLSAKEKRVWTNKINETVNMVDPRILESQPITENIKSLESELQYWNDKTDVEPDVKASKVEALENQIKEAKKERIDIFATPLEKYETKPEKKSETTPKDLEKASIPIIGAENNLEINIPESVKSQAELENFLKNELPIGMPYVKDGMRYTRDNNGVLHIEDIGVTERKKAEKAPKEEVKAQTPEEIAKAIGIKSTGVEDYGEGNVKDAYEFITPKGQPDSFTVDKGSSREVVEAKFNQMRDKWGKETPIEETPEAKKVRINDRLADLKDEYNKIPASYNVKRAAVMRQIQSLLPQVEGYEMTTEGSKIGILNKKGNKIIRSKIKGEWQKIENIEDPEAQKFVRALVEARENLYGLDLTIGGKVLDKAIDDIKIGRANAMTQQVIDALVDMHRTGIIKFKGEGQPDMEITVKEVSDQLADTKLKAFDEKYGELTVDNLEKAVEEGLIDKADIKNAKKILEDDNANRTKIAEEWDAEQSRVATEGESGEVSNKTPENKKEIGANEVKPEIVPDEKPVIEPNPPVSKGEENILPGGTETGVKPIEAKGAEKPVRTTDPVKQKQIEAIDTDYDAQIAEKQSAITANKKAKDKALAEAQDRQGLFGDTKDTGEAKMFSQEEQGFALTPERLKAIEKPFDANEAELNKQIASLNKERESKIGEVLKQQTLGFEEPSKPGIQFKDKTYQSVDEVTADFDKFPNLTEYNKVLQQVRDYEEKLRVDAEKKAGDIKNLIDRGVGDFEDQIKKDIDDKNSKTYLKFFPDLWSALGTAQWNVFRPMRDALANTIAGQLKKGVTSQTDGVRWATKVLTNLYNGLIRTEKDMHGSGLTGHIGKLEMTGTVKAYAPHKANDLLNTWRDVVNSDPESLRRVLDVLDPDPEFATEKLSYGDLSVAEKNLFFTLKEWNTWVHETNYANGLIPTETYLKFKDVTGDSKYIARMYDKYEGEHILDPTIQQFIERGNSAVTTKMFGDMYKARQEADEWKKAHAIRDPAYLTAKRVMQTIQNVAIKQYMDMIIDQHPDYVKKVKKGEDIPKGYTMMGSSYNWGPFRNRAVANHIVEDLTGFFYANKVVNTAYDAMKMWDRTKLNQFYKKYRTVYNPFVQTGNVTGNVFFASINGINPFSFVKGMIDNRNLHEKNPAQYDLLLKSGLIGDVGITGEMKPLDILKPKEGALGKADEIATRAYVGADNLAKISAYQIYRRQGMSHEAAVRRAYDAFQNYATVGKTWDISSKIPLIGPTFVKFQADLQRILVNNLLTTPLTTIGTLMAVKMLGNLSSAMSGETEEEQKVRESRKGVAKIPFVNIPLSFKIGKSEVNVARYLSPLYLYNRGDSEMELSELSKFMPIQFQQKEEGKMFPLPAFADATWGWLGSVIADKDFRGVSIADPSLTKFTDPNTPTDVKIFNIMNYIARSQIPFYKGAADIINGATGQLDYYGRKRTWAQAIINNVVKIQQFDKPELKNYVERNLNYLTSRYASLATKMGDAQGVFYKTIKDAEDKGLSAEAQKKIIESASKLRDKSINKSLNEQLPVFKEIERLTGVYKNWNPEDPFVQENYANIEAGKNQVFNVLDIVDFQKKHPAEFTLLKKNDLLKRPDLLKYNPSTGKPLTEEERKLYASTYWSEYLRGMDSQVGLTQEEIDDMKQRRGSTEKADTPTGLKDKSLLEIRSSAMASEANRLAREAIRNQ